MVRVGGHFTQLTVANNFMGHGFWQISPELIYRIFTPSNGYRVVCVLLHEVMQDGAWYLVRDPKDIGHRVELCNSVPTYILTIAKRINVTEIFAEMPQQSDYVAEWGGLNDSSSKLTRDMHEFDENFSSPDFQYGYCSSCKERPLQNRTRALFGLGTEGRSPGFARILLDRRIQPITRTVIPRSQAGLLRVIRCLVGQGRNLCSSALVQMRTPGAA